MISRSIRQKAVDALREGGISDKLSISVREYGAIAWMEAPVERGAPYVALAFKILQHKERWELEFLLRRGFRHHRAEEAAELGIALFGEGNFLQRLTRLKDLAESYIEKCRELEAEERASKGNLYRIELKAISDALDGFLINMPSTIPHQWRYIDSRLTIDAGDGS